MKWRTRSGAMVEDDREEGEDDEGDGEDVIEEEE